MVTETHEVADKTSISRNKRNVKVGGKPVTPKVTSTLLRNDDVSPRVIEV